MEDLRNKQRAFLAETVAHYNSENRSQNEKGSCKYYPAHDNTEGCAIGRKIEDKELCKALDNGTSASVYISKVFNQLPESLKELDKYFLTRVQALHDHCGNWDSEGLSDQGKLAVREIEKEFELVKE